MEFKKAYLYIEGSECVIEAQSFGAEGTKVGEIIFNTSLCGYQEIISDPSYAGQFVVFTMPEIGIVGVNDDDTESPNPHICGIIVRHYNATHSNFRAKDALHNYLKKHGVMGISNIDTRFLTKFIRENGAKNIIISTELNSVELLKNALDSADKIADLNLIKDVSTKAKKSHTQGNFSFEKMSYTKPKMTKKIIVLDFGVKQNILNELCNVGFECEILPHSASADEIIARFKKGEIGGVFLSNGPGDPQILRNEINEIKKLISAKIPIFGICLGHQLLSLAHGYETYKLEFGHHGANHPVKDLRTNEIEITSQNHIYSVPDSLCEVAEVTHQNLFDGTIEGVRYKDSPIISLQHHPEASPGPKESAKIFKEFFEMVK